MERNTGHKKQTLTFAAYCGLIEELLRLTQRRIAPRKPISPKSFKL